jgi:hypothetical protein
MKHILHQNVIGKQLANGKTYFQVYISFTINRQTYRLKSQLVSRPVTKEEYKILETLYKGKLSDLLGKEREILTFCIKKNTVEDELDRNQLRNDYIFFSTSITDMLEKMRNSIEISDWTIPNISWELTKDLNLDEDLISELSKYEINDLLLTELIAEINNYKLWCRKKGIIEGLFLLYDFKYGTLTEDFKEYLGERMESKQSEPLLKLLTMLIKK